MQPAPLARCIAIVGKVPRTTIVIDALLEAVAATCMDTGGCEGTIKVFQKSEVGMLKEQQTVKQVETWRDGREIGDLHQETRNEANRGSAGYAFRRVPAAC